jgi:hypothetical protein
MIIKNIQKKNTLSSDIILKNPNFNKFKFYEKKLYNID